MTSPATETDANDGAIESALRAVAVFAVAFAALAALGWGWAAAASTAAGGAVALGNLYVIGRLVRATLVAPPEGEGAEAPRSAGGSALGWSVVAVLKMLVLFGGLWLAMRRGLVQPLPLAAGYMSLVAGIATAAVLPARRPSRRRTL